MMLKKKKEKQRRLYSLRSPWLGEIHPGACADGSPGQTAVFLRQPGRLLLEPLFSPLWLGPETRVGSSPRRPWGQQSPNLHVSWCCCLQLEPLPESADPRALKHSQQGAVAPVVVSLEAVCVRVCVCVSGAGERDRPTIHSQSFLLSSSDAWRSSMFPKR